MVIALSAGCGPGTGTPDAAADAHPEDAPDVIPGDAGEPDAGLPPGLEWPNEESQATSDPWILENHDRIGVMRPRILALNFVNGRSNDDMLRLMNDIIAAIREGTRPHGYEDPAAQPFLQYEVAYAVDLTDATPPPGWPYRNSTLYPREDPVEGTWGFDYEQLFGEEMAARYGIEDPDAPGRFLTLCELSERGLVHEVWIYGDADVPDVAAAEILGIMPRYDETGARIPGLLDRCAANGCFDAEDEIPATCTRTLRIGWVNNTRGVGCYMESLSHGIERIGSGNYVPYLTPYFRELAGFDLNLRYGLSERSWYEICSGVGDCLSYPTPRSVRYNGRLSGTLDPYVPVCGSAHFPPNARDHYDIVNTTEVMSTCRGYRTAGGPGAGDPEEPVSAADWERYSTLAPDCTGAWIVWWWQNIPGRGSPARDDTGAPMRNWWPFLFY